MLLLALAACFPSLPEFVPVDSDLVLDSADSSEPVDTGPFDLDQDGVQAREDCDDEDPEVHPGATERWNLADDDCDGESDRLAVVDVARARIDGTGRQAIGVTRALAVLPDVTGDGHPEIAVGTPSTAPDTWLYLLDGAAAVGGGSALGLAEVTIFVEDEILGAELRLGRDISAPARGRDALPDLLTVAHENEWGIGGAYLGGLDDEGAPRLDGRIDVQAVDHAFGESTEGPFSLDLPGLRAIAAGPLLGDPDESLADVIVGYTLTEQSTSANHAQGLVAVFEGESLVADQRQGHRTAGVYGDLGDHLGASLAVADLDGDGVVDLVAGAPGRGGGDGAVYLLPGPAEGWADTVAGSGAVAILGQDGELLGDLGGVPQPADLDGDGHLDLVLLSPAADRAAVVFGQTEGLPVTQASLLANVVDVTVSGEGAVGTSAVAADLDGDELPELVVGVPGAGEVTGEAPGEVWVFQLGGTPAAALGRTDAVAVLTGPAAGGWLGSAVAAGDLDGDGTNELVLGAPTWNLLGEPGVYDGALFLLTIEVP